MKAPRLVTTKEIRGCKGCLFINDKGLCELALMGMSPNYFDCRSSIFILEHTKQQTLDQIQEIINTKKIKDIPEEIYNLFEVVK